MSNREVVEPTTDDRGREQHPAFGKIGASRVTGSATLFDSEIRHEHYVVLRIDRAYRRRELNRDWISSPDSGGVVEVAMSEAQWASFVSSMNTSGVPCTLTRTEVDGWIPELPFSPRMAESMDEVRSAAVKAFAAIKEARDAYEANKTKGNLRALHFAIENAPSHLTFAAESLTEHAENVVQKARADIEAMVVAKAQALGLSAGDVAAIGNLDADGPAELEAGDGA